MNDLISKVASDIDKWAETVRISDNPNDNPLVDSYNKGVDAMANKVKYYLEIIIIANGGDQ